MREKGENVIDVNFDETEIYNAIKIQIEHGEYKQNPIYGNGSAGKSIAEILSTKSVEIQKLITF